MTFWGFAMAHPYLATLMGVVCTIGGLVLILLFSEVEITWRNRK